MLGVLKDHIDRFVLEDDFLHGDHILVADLPVQLGSQLGDRHAAMEWGRTVISRMALWLIPV